jgi:hypothetical protein
MTLRPALIVVLLAAAVAPAARADDSAPPATQTTMPGWGESSRYRHFAGLQAGGSAPLALTYRYRLFGPLLLDVGGFGAPEAVAIVTGGIVVELHETSRLVAYGGGGGSASLLGNETLAFLYPRLGLAVKLGAQREHRIALDVGLWWGEHQVFDKDTGAQTLDKRFLVPMAGVSYLAGFGRL